MAGLFTRGRMRFRLTTIRSMLWAGFAVTIVLLTAAGAVFSAAPGATRS